MGEADQARFLMADQKLANSRPSKASRNRDDIHLRSIVYEHCCSSSQSPCRGLRISMHLMVANSAQRPTFRSAAVPRRNAAHVWGSGRSAVPRCRDEKLLTFEAVYFGQIVIFSLPRTRLGGPKACLLQVLQPPGPRQK